MKSWKEIEILQQELCLKHKLNWQPFNRTKWIVINDSIYSEIEPINGLRHPEHGSVDGWYLWSGGGIPQDEDNFFKVIHVEHLITDLPICLKYLGLPAGWRFQIDRKGYEDVWYDKKLLDI